VVRSRAQGLREKAARDDDQGRRSFCQGEEPNEGFADLSPRH
jgi:hypothetical protein